MRPLFQLSTVLVPIFWSFTAPLCGQQPESQSPATSVGTREASWQRHVAMRDTSPFRHLKWESVGPRFQGGRIESIAVSPLDTAVRYVGVGSGGLWKTENNGMTWTPIFQQRASVAIGAVAVSPSDPDTVWLGTGEVLLARSSLPGMGVFKSEDEGQTWTNMGLKDTQHIARAICWVSFSPILVHVWPSSSDLKTPIPGNEERANSTSPVPNQTVSGSDGETATAPMATDARCWKMGVHVIPLFSVFQRPPEPTPT